MKLLHTNHLNHMQLKDNIIILWNNFSFVFELMLQATNFKEVRKKGFHGSFPLFLKKNKQIVYKKDAKGMSPIYKSGRYKNIMPLSSHP